MVDGSVWFCSDSIDDGDSSQGQTKSNTPATGWSANKVTVARANEVS